MTMLQAAAFYLLCWAAFVRAETTSGRLWQDIGRCAVYSLNNNYTQAFDNVLSPLTCCFTCLAEKGCEYFYYSRQETRCLIFPPPCLSVLDGGGPGYQLFRTPAVAKCPLENGYYYYSDSHLCLRLEFLPFDWETALYVCQDEGGHPMVIKSKLEFTNLQEFILNVQDHLDNLTFFWLGARYDTAQLGWRWIDNTPVADDNEWNPEQPEPGPGENYLMMGKSFELAADVVEAEHPMVCEVDID